MEDIDRDTIELLRTWLSNRRLGSDYYHSSVVVHPSEGLRHLALPDLHLNRFTRFACSPKQEPHQNQTKDTHLNSTLKSLSRLLTSLRSYRRPLEFIEFLRLGGSTGGDRHTAAFNLDEAIQLIQTCLTLDWALDIHVDQLDCVFIEDSAPTIQSLVSRICVLLFSSSPARVVARYSHYGTCLLGAFLVDLFHEAGFSAEQLQLLVSDCQREAATGAPDCGSSWLLSPLRPEKAHKQSLIAICFADTQIVPALRSILASLAREFNQRHNLILLVEEAIYDTFLYHWENNSDKILPPLQDKDIKIDLNCIDIRLANRMSKPCINVIKFRSLEDLQNLMVRLRKVLYIQLWSSDHIFIREVAFTTLSMAQCDQFWLNQTRPENITGHQFGWQLIKYYKKSMRPHMDGVYTSVFYDYEERLESLRERSVKFANSADRVKLTIRVYINLISKFKSMKQMSLTVNESACRLRRFRMSSAIYSTNVEGESEIETILQPTGLAILSIRSEHCVKSKPILVDFIFKNLILGNGVMLLCPAAVLGARFFNELLKFDELPFDWVDPKTSADVIISAGEALDLSVAGSTEADSSWDSTDSGLNNSIMRKQLKCPKSIYAVEINKNELTLDTIDLLVLALGAKHRSVWYCTESLLPAEDGEDV